LVGPGEKGGEVLVTIEGLNFGESARVYIGENECLVQSRSTYPYFDISMNRTLNINRIMCLLPGNTVSSDISIVKVQNGVLPGLFYEYPGLKYRVIPPLQIAPGDTNIGNLSIGINA
jgi:hypothetical protein